MSTGIRFRQLAELDLAQHLEWLTQQASPRTAHRFLERLAATLEMLTRQPHVGRHRHCANPSIHDARSIPVRGFRNWVVFYEPGNDGIEVLRILHGRRDLTRLLADPGEVREQRARWRRRTVAV